MLWSLETTAESRFSLSRVDAVQFDDDELRDAIGAQSDAAADRLDPDAGDVVQAVWFDAAPQRRGGCCWWCTTSPSTACRGGS